MSRRFGIYFMQHQIKLKQGRERSLFYRHPWIFSGAIEQKSIPAEMNDGDICAVCDAGGNFLATGYYNSRSNIAVRVLSFDDGDVIDASFLERRVSDAYNFRRKFIDEKITSAFRVVFAEGDMLPGLVVDKYGDVLVVQIHTLGMDKMRSEVVKALVKFFNPSCIYERSDVAARKQDGLKDLPCGLLYGDESSLDGLKIRENGLEFYIDVRGGQKTGFFLDQRENRLASMKYAAGRKVLNLFSYSGGFSAYALSAGALHVTSVDASEEAVKLCSENLSLNGFSSNQHEEICADVFKYLESCRSSGKKFGLVIVDPPAFVKSQKNVDAALKAYAKLNEAALGVLEDGGVLISSSCSHYVPAELFRKSLFQAALHAKKDLRLMESRTQPIDHPVRLYFPEGEYLKFFVLG